MAKTIPQLPVEAKPTSTGPRAPVPSRPPKIAIILLVVALGLTVIGIIGVLWSLNYLRQQPKVSDQAGEFLQQINTYPESYKDADLPQYPAASITHFGPADAKPTDEDGVFIVITTDDDLKKVAKSFETQMKRRGWSLKSANNTASDVLISRTYSKDSQEYRLTINRDPETKHTSVIIKWAQN